jgi:site-specific recombinase XerD
MNDLSNLNINNTTISELLQIIQKISHISEILEPKKYYLDKVKNKKLGYVYYVRYVDNGIVVPSHWTTKTNNIELAEKYAIENRERLLTKYYCRDIIKKPYGVLYTILKNYYSKNSPYLDIDIKRGRITSDKSRTTYNNFINRQFIPYLKKHGIKDFDEIDTPLLSRLQNYLLIDKKTKNGITHGIKPQTINHYISYVSLIFDHLIQEGQMKINPCKSLITLKIKQDDQKVTGCYEINKLKGVFNRKWKNELSYLLSLIMYTTNIRNNEIEKIQVKDIFMIDNFHFIDVDESKTKNGIRIVPLHIFVFRKIAAYIRKNKLMENDFIFKLPNCKRLGSRRYKTSLTELAEYAGYSKDRLKKENIRFYSGRHFWKTLMNSENLGDVEEYFMGHKVSADVAKRYNHRDKQGKRKLLESP